MQSKYENIENYFSAINKNRPANMEPLSLQTITPALVRQYYDTILGQFKSGLVKGSDPNLKAISLLQELINTKAPLDTGKVIFLKSFVDSIIDNDCKDDIYDRIIEHEQSLLKKGGYGKLVIKPTEKPGDLELHHSLRELEKVTAALEGEAPVTPPPSAPLSSSSIEAAKEITSEEKPKKETHGLGKWFNRVVRGSVLQHKATADESLAQAESLRSDMLRNIEAVRNMSDTLPKNLELVKSVISNYCEQDMAFLSKLDLVDLTQKGNLHAELHDFIERLKPEALREDINQFATKQGVQIPEQEMQRVLNTYYKLVYPQAEMLGIEIESKTPKGMFSSRH